MSLPRILRPPGAGRFVLFCDHASNYIPAELDDLGLPACELARHIAWDISADRGDGGHATCRHACPATPGAAGAPVAPTACASRGWPRVPNRRRR